MIQGKVAVVTGAAGTLCSVISKELAKCNAKVILADRNEEKIKLIAEEIRANGGQAETYVCDILNPDSVKALADFTKKTFGNCNLLINGAGGNNIAAMPTITKFDPRELNGGLNEGERGIFSIDMAAFENVLRLNTMGTFYPTLEFAKQMVEQGGGAVLNFASMNTYCPLTRNYAYAMGKAAIANLTQSLAAYFAPAGIRINAVAPGFIVNERSIHYLGSPEIGLTKRGEDVIKHTPMQRFGEAQDLLGCVKFLLDDEMSAFVTGITVPVDGGFLTLGGV